MQTTPDTHNPDSQPCECRTATGQVDMCSLDGMYHCVRGRGEHAVNCRLSRKRGHLAEAGGSANFVRGPLLSAESRILVVGGWCTLSRTERQRSLRWTIDRFAYHAVNELSEGK
jgi:hypothetical protein